ncbi:DUF6438 domain-containing protein [Aestuariivivens sediminicola]|uniref:DUF6438 domain-containing protein n=1 Tax=Aestuariivivens sediminicola TaxID=2913560 RepID=UPI001F560150|nr:DUF6438 domain-containing protein [Aestuariivivens sediminicola]
MTLLTSYFVSKPKRLEQMDDAFLSLTKGKSITNNPVFDLWVFESGTVIYKGISNVEKTGVHKTTITLETINKIKSLVNHLSPDDVGDAKGRENPLTIIKFNERKMVYQSVRAKGSLFKLNNLLENIASTINSDD